MILFELTGTENNPVYQELEISNGNRQYDFLRSRKAKTSLRVVALRPLVQLVRDTGGAFRRLLGSPRPSRWKGDLPVAIHAGELQIGDMVFPCSVLSDGTRILTQTDFMKGMGMYYSGWVAQKQSQNESAAEVPHFLAFRALEPFIDRHLGDLQSISVKYRTGKGNIAHGIKAEIIPKIEEGPSEEAARGRLAEAGIQEIGPGFPL